MFSSTTTLVAAPQQLFLTLRRRQPAASFPAAPQVCRVAGAKRPSIGSRFIATSSTTPSAVEDEAAAASHKRVHHGVFDRHATLPSNIAVSVSAEGDVTQKQQPSPSFRPFHAAAASSHISTVSLMVDDRARGSDRAFDLAHLLAKPDSFQPLLKYHFRTTPSMSQQAVRAVCATIFAHCSSPETEQQALSTLRSIHILHETVHRLGFADAATLVPKLLLRTLLQQEISAVPEMFPVFRCWYAFALQHSSTKQLQRVARRAARSATLHLPLLRLLRDTLLQRGVTPHRAWLRRLYNPHSQQVTMDEFEETEAEERARTVTQNEEIGDVDDADWITDDDSEATDNEDGGESNISGKYTVVQEELGAFFDRCTCDIDTSEVDAAPSSDAAARAEAPQSAADLYSLYAEWSQGQEYGPFAWETCRWWLEKKAKELLAHPHLAMRLPKKGRHAHSLKYDTHTCSGINEHIFPYERIWTVVEECAFAVRCVDPVQLRVRLSVRHNGQN